MCPIQPGDVISPFADDVPFRIERMKTPEPRAIGEVMIAPTPLEPMPQTPPILGGSLFLRRLQIATYGLLLFVLIIYLLDKFRDILQPLFVAMFLGFLMHPVHRWLVKRGV